MMASSLKYFSLLSDLLLISRWAPILVKKVAKFLEKGTEMETSSLMAFDQSRLNI